jgi:hypothetical protein
MGEAPAFGQIVAWVVVLFGLPAVVCLLTAAHQWRQYRTRRVPLRPDRRGWAAAGVLGLAATGALLIGCYCANADGLRDGMALTAWGAAGLYLAGGLLGLVRPDIGRTTLGTAAVLAWAVALLGPQFLAPADAHAVPAGPTPSSVAMAITAFLLVFPPPAVFAALLFHGAAHRQPVPAPAAERFDWPAPDAARRTVALPARQPAGPSRRLPAP